LVDGFLLSNGVVLERLSETATLFRPKQSLSSGACPNNAGTSVGETGDTADDKGGSQLALRADLRLGWEVPGEVQNPSRELVTATPKLETDLWESSEQRQIRSLSWSNHVESGRRNSG
jgi:hypothetical protein